ncbi:hypothetical protein ACB098_03G155400 [Castanea mollissima]
MGFNYFLNTHIIHAKTHGSLLCFCFLLSLKSPLLRYPKIANVLFQPRLDRLQTFNSLVHHLKTTTKLIPDILICKKLLRKKFLPTQIPSCYLLKVWASL